MNLNKQIERIRKLQPSEICCPACSGQKRIIVDHPLQLNGHETIDISCEKCNGTGKVLPPVEDMVIEVIYMLSRSSFTGLIKQIAKVEEMLGREYVNEGRLDCKENLIAAAFIKLVELCEEPESIEDLLPNSLKSTQFIISIIKLTTSKKRIYTYETAAADIIAYCKSQNIDLEKHVEARLAYLEGE